MAVDLRHGGNRDALAEQLGCRPEQLLDASASLVPWTPRLRLNTRQTLRDYPDRRQQRLRQVIADCHELDPDQVLAGNGAAELFTWAARDAASAGLNVLLAPGFADYPALSTQNNPPQGMPLCRALFQVFSIQALAMCLPASPNPTGQP